MALQSLSALIEDYKQLTGKEPCLDTLRVLHNCQLGGRELKKVTTETVPEVKVKAAPGGQAVSAKKGCAFPKPYKFKADNELIPLAEAVAEDIVEVAEDIDEESMTSIEKILTRMVFAFVSKAIVKHVPALKAAAKQCLASELELAEKIADSS
jgi:hypothetical protein